ncbi:hypothetical protein AALP_AAs55493U000100 [Arabis alpina]|uniref:Uncharacterized protein n=1 Tax=Arabis alpina TaxID=50452 RepID=A0A087FWN6_ARAAL|nr:hypothetical protein AALP_AAs55493U000100 [Arabis alpina]
MKRTQVRNISKERCKELYKKDCECRVASYSCVLCEQTDYHPRETVHSPSNIWSLSYEILCNG